MRRILQLLVVVAGVVLAWGCGDSATQGSETAGTESPDGGGGGSTPGTTIGHDSGLGVGLSSAGGQTFGDGYQLTFRVAAPATAPLAESPEFRINPQESGVPVRPAQR